MNYRYIH